MKIIVQYHGAFRALGESATLEVPSPAPIHEIKTALAHALGDQHKGLIMDSVLADETNILRDHDVIERDCTLSILPPVCGG